MAEKIVQPIRGQHLHIAPFHHRSIFGDLPALRDSIVAEGIINPLIVRKLKTGGYEIVAGVRRFKAGTMAELKTFPCLVEDLDDIDAMARQFAENQDREGLHPIDVALYCHELSKTGMDSAAIAKKLCLKKRDVVQKTRLLALSANARKAFVAGKFDEESALALTTTSDWTKQADVLAALDAGSLQAEEIVGYIRRTFTASLDHVPWRMTDEKLVVKAGACTQCPKRSDVQRDMFPKESTGLRCLDVDCWRAKMEATWQGELARPDVAVFEQAADTVFAIVDDGIPSVLRSSGMVDADATCPHLTLPRTWREAVFSAIPDGAESPSVYLARDQDGRPRFLMREATVARLVKKSPGARREPDEEKPTTDTATQAPPRDDAATSQRAENRIRRTLIQTFAERVTSGDHDTWAWVVDRVVDGATARSVSVAADLLESAMRGIEPEGLTGKAGLLALAASANRQAKRVATAILIFEDADVVGELSPALHELAKACDLDIAAIDREIRTPK